MDDHIKLLMAEMEDLGTKEKQLSAEVALLEDHTKKLATAED